MFSIARSLTVFAVGILLGQLAILEAASTALNQLRIGGDSYKVIIDAKDLVADILPPPLYVIEAYLEAKLTAEDQAQVASHKARLIDLKKDFDARRQVWRGSALPAQLRDQLLETASREADVFWTEIFTAFLPAVEARSDSKASMARLDKAYRLHRAAVDTTVTAATKFQTDAEQAAESNNTFWNWLVYTTGTIVLAAVMGGVLGVKWRVVRPIVAMTDAMRRLAAGDESIVVPAQGRRDEVGSMAAALQVFKDSAIEKRQLEAKAELDRRALDDSRAANDRDRAEAEQVKTRDLLAMVEQVERETKGAVSAVVALMDDMTGITRDMSATANDLSVNSETVARAADETQHIMEAAKAATERLSTSIDRVAEQVRTTHDVTAKAVRASENTGRSIEALQHVVHEITGVTKIITDIARQTSLLAINAGVEATRSGQDGRGFAVIALEVKNLSEQTSGATNKISELVRQVHESTGSAVSAVTDIARTIQSVNEAAADMAFAIEEQVEMTRNIASSVTETTSAAVEVTMRVQQVAEEASATGLQARRVDEVCSEVAGHVRALHTTLIRIVRTCSAEIDRRSQKRVPYGEELASVELNGQRVQVALNDASAGGAQLRGRVGRVGERVKIRLPGLSEAIQCHIVDQTDETTHLKFVSGQTALQRIQELLNSRLHGRQAA